MAAMNKSGKDRVAEEVIDLWVTFQMALSNKRKYPAVEFNAFAKSVRRYVSGTLRFLVLTMFITPLRRITGWHSLIRFRRMLGLFAFFYACLHFITHVWLDQFFAFDKMMKDLTQRPFMMAGYASFVLLTQVAMPSTD